MISFGTLEIPWKLPASWSLNRRMCGQSSCLTFEAEASYAAAGFKEMQKFKEDAKLGGVREIPKDWERFTQAFLKGFNAEC